MNKPLNLYFHVPFCVSKCNYCAFYSKASPQPDWESYLKGIIGEIDFWYEKIGKAQTSTIFFGGGTPSLMPAQIFEKIINHANNKFQFIKSAEITCESNPGTMDLQKLSDFKSIGMNRLSVGVQSFNDTELEFLGRKHTAKQATDLIKSAINMGLNTSGDFIYGLPNQTVKNVKEICEKINDIGLKHCSMYELSIEPGTVFGIKNLQTPDDEIKAQMFEAIAENLNLARYEVSNYAAPGHQCEHNNNIWKGDSYIGFGRGAVGRVLINNIWYEQNGANPQIKELSHKERAMEKVMTGMRIIQGIELAPDILDVLDMKFINKNTEFFVKTDKKIAVSEKGILILDYLILNMLR